MKNLKRTAAYIMSAAMVIGLLPAGSVLAATVRGDETLYEVTFPASSGRNGYSISTVDTLYGGSDETPLEGDSVEVVDGDDLTFAVDVEDSYKTSSDVTVYADGQRLRADSDGFYTVEDVSRDTTVEVAGVSQSALTYYTVSVPTSSYYTIEPLNDSGNDASKVIAGGYYRFDVNVAPAYSNSTYTVSANGQPLTADDGVYTVPVSADTAITVDGTFTQNSYKITTSYNSTLYRVQINGQATDPDGSVQAAYGSTASIDVTALGSDGITVIAGNKVLATVSGGSLHTELSGIASDTVVKIVPSTCGVTVFRYSGDLLGTAWTYGYEGGSGSVLGYGDDLKFYVQLKKGYTNSPLDVWARVNGTGMSIEPVSVDTENHIYHYEIDNITYSADRGSTVTDIQITVASANARFISRKPIQANSYTATFYQEEGSSDVYATEETSYGDTITRPSDPERAGYTFDAWVNAAGRKYNFNKTVKGNVKLYATWKKGSSVNGLTITKVPAKVYTGKAIRPAVTVRDGSKTLKAGTDYSVSYSNNTQVGQARITITGQGDYAGTKTIYFTINPKATKITSVKQTAKKKVTVKWKKAAAADQYILYRGTSAKGTFKKLKTVKAVKYVDQSVKAGRKYYYKVKVVQGAYKSAFSNVKGN